MIRDRFHQRNPAHLFAFGIMALLVPLSSAEYFVKKKKKPPILDSD